ncbi:MAG: glycosyltransferase [Acidobacteria bacterium]|nr:glycosyltransferase [Acidobacteriota bacterium]
MCHLRILHIVSIVAPRYGGAGISSQSIARYQAKAGHAVTLWTTNADYPKGYLSVPSERAVIDNDLVKRHFPVQFRPLLISLPLRTWLKHHIRSFDIVHIHGLYRFPVSYAAWKARHAGVPYIIAPHGSLDPFLYRQSRYGASAMPLKRIYERLFDFPNLNHAAAIQYTSEEEAKRAAFLGLRAKPVIVPNGIAWESYENLPAKGSFREKLGIPKQAPLVLFLGRINFVKGLDLLVPAFSQIAQREPRARLAIVGPDNDGYGAKVKRWCRDKGVEDKVFFVDHLYPEDVKRAYVDASVFVLPSYTENFGMAVVEAMACGCPVVISDQVKIWREIQEDGAGLVVCLDPRRISDAVCRLLSNKEEAEAMGTQGRRAARMRYAWPRVVVQMTQVYRDIINDATSWRATVQPPSSSQNEIAGDGYESD